MMDPTSTDKRREPRLEIRAGTAIALYKKAQVLNATTVNMSGCGVLLQLADSVHLAVGDSVMCDFNVQGQADQTLPCWAEGTVVRVEGDRVAVDFRGGGWTKERADTAPPDKAR
jgi:hypothetical protein